MYVMPATADTEKRHTLTEISDGETASKTTEASMSAANDATNNNKKEPKVIAVKGLFVDAADSGVRYEADKMGNFIAQEEAVSDDHDGQRDPLTETKPTKNKAEEEVEDFEDAVEVLDERGKDRKGSEKVKVRNKSGSGGNISVGETGAKNDQEKRNSKHSRDSVKSNKSNTSSNEKLTGSRSGSLTRKGDSLTRKGGSLTRNKGSLTRKSGSLKDKSGGSNVGINNQDDVAVLDVNDDDDGDKNTNNNREKMVGNGANAINIATNSNATTTEDIKGSKDDLKINKDGSYEIDGRKQPEDEVVVMVASKDDIDAASMVSLFMERDFRYYFQHPWSRLFIAYFVVFCNFLIYAEDPVAHSRKECLIPMIGNTFAFIGTRYPPNAWSLLKVIFWLIGLVVGMFVGKLLIHGLLFNRVFRLKMFSECQGSWMIMFMVSLVTVFIMSCFYNLFLLIGGESTEPYRISDLMGVRNTIFMKVAACGTWCGDFFTAWMVTDIMLQEKLYPGWARPVRKWWVKGWNRIVLFWIVVVITSFAVIFTIATDYIQWDKLNHDFLPTNEVSRAFLASSILVMDLLIVMQDWDFPHFMSNIDVKLPGVNTAHIKFSIPNCLKRERWDVHITGKWFNYGILFLVMLLDMNMWKNQIFYQPYDYGQYVNYEDRIYSVQDDFSLDHFNESQITYEYRSTQINAATNKTYVESDTFMHTKYFGLSIAFKALAFIPSIASFIVFGVLIWKFGRFKPTDTDPYAGRLKKRVKKRRFSFRLPWRRREELRRKVHAVPKLLYFKRKGNKGSEKAPKEIPTSGFTDNGGIEEVVEQTGTSIQQTT